MNSIEFAKVLVNLINGKKGATAVIAGGYVRDTAVGRFAKDIDILVHWETFNDMCLIEQLAQTQGYTVTDYGESYGEAADEGLVRVINLENQEDIGIDVIFTRQPPHQRIADFPCNASMFWLEGDTIGMSPQAEEWLRTGNLEFYRLATPEYINRMYEYFPK